jgi:hypothetical protein
VEAHVRCDKMLQRDNRAGCFLGEQYADLLQGLAEHPVYCEMEAGFSNTGTVNGITSNAESTAERVVPVICLSSIKL